MHEKVLTNITRLNVVGALSLTSWFANYDSRNLCLFLVPFAANTCARYASTSFAPNGTIQKCQNSLLYLVSQANKSVVYAGYKRGYILVQQADFRTCLLVFCIHRSTALRNGRLFHAGHLAEKLIRHLSQECTKLSVLESDRHETCGIGN